MARRRNPASYKRVYKRQKKVLLPGAAIPEAQIRWVVGNFHVGEPDSVIAADMERRTKSWPEEASRRAIEYAIKVHHDNQKMYRSVMTGRFNPTRRRRARKNPSGMELSRQGRAGHRSFLWTSRGVNYAVTFEPSRGFVLLYEYTGHGERARDRFAQYFRYDPWGPLPKKLVDRIGVTAAKKILSAGAGRY